MPALLAHKDLSNFEPISATTVNKLLNLLSAIVTFAAEEGMLDSSPNFINAFKGSKVSIDNRTVEPRKVFTTEDLKALYGTAIYRENARPRGGGGEAAFWLPLIALFTGARQAELGQLRLEDLRQDGESGVWFFDISTAGGRSIKTASSRRRVPVHPQLIAIGLLRYRDELEARQGGAKGNLWPDIKSDREGRQAGPWSQWFTRHLRDVANIADRGEGLPLVPPYLQAHGA